MTIKNQGPAKPNAGRHSAISGKRRADPANKNSGDAAKKPAKKHPGKRGY